MDDDTKCLPRTQKILYRVKCRYFVTQLKPAHERVFLCQIAVQYGKHAGGGECRLFSLLIFTTRIIGVLG